MVVTGGGRETASVTVGLRTKCMFWGSGEASCDFVRTLYEMDL